MQVKRSLEANYAAYEALRNGLKPGISEKDAYELVREAVDRVCGAESHEFVGDFVGGVRTGAISLFVAARSGAIRAARFS